MVTVHQNYINRINREGANLRLGIKAQLTLHKTLLEVERHLSETFDEDRPPPDEPDPWIDLYHRYMAARKYLDRPEGA